jgi:hypothetical protein
MGRFRTRKLAGTGVAVAAIATALIIVLGGAAGARTRHQIPTQKLLALAPGSFEVSLGNAPAWLPLSGVPETLTLIAGAPTSPRAAADNVYLGFVPATTACARTPGTSGRTFLTLGGFFSRAHGAATHAGVFAPNGGAAASTHIESVGEVVVPERGTAHVCVWLARTIGLAVKPRPVKGKHHKHKVKVKPPKRSLVATLSVPLLNSTFAASVSNLSGATGGAAGVNMFAIDGGRAFRYSANSTQCGRTAADPASTVAAGTPASESLSIGASPCTTDTTTFHFSVGGVSQTLTYPIADAVATPTTSVGIGGCELDPLTGATLANAEAYLTAVGCSVAAVQVTPAQTSLPRGAVAWAAVDGGVAELAPTGTAVTLVVNGAS